MEKEEIGTDVKDFEPSLFHIIGQKKAISILKCLIEQYTNDKMDGRSVSIPSILLVGNEGFGKRTIAKVISDAFGNTEFKTAVGQTLCLGDDFGEFFKDTNEDTTLYIDTCQSIHPKAQTRMFRLINDNVLYVDKLYGEFETEYFPNHLIIFSATNTKRLCSSLMKAIDITITLSDYSDNEISLIIDQRIKALNWEIETEDILKMITQYSQNNPAKAMDILQMAYRIMRSSDKDILEMSHIKKALYLLDYQVSNVKNEVKDSI